MPLAPLSGAGCLLPIYARLGLLGGLSSCPVRRVCTCPLLVHLSSATFSAQRCCRPGPRAVCCEVRWGTFQQEKASSSSSSSRGIWRMGCV
ncbi:hypothetical protein DL89DRAFT_18202 [Linderina pennispora]|uniref:Secreted protein n=1 Tax=Linderina pennispora TaxID=61395 RepID=A0A1Y1WLS2_9FUNG|nr:uncharacterized protein DL89DRAFT_18202 [Linderina pennispora]ORX74509.1 hypothetical protein DL89DRAFT_18202 [Linderina pennispora]